MAPLSPLLRRRGGSNHNRDARLSLVILPPTKKTSSNRAVGNKPSPQRSPRGATTATKSHHKVELPLAPTLAVLSPHSPSHRKTTTAVQSSSSSSPKQPRRGSLSDALKKPKKKIVSPEKDKSPLLAKTLQTLNLDDQISVVSRGADSPPPLKTPEKADAPKTLDSALKHPTKPKRHHRRVSSVSTTKTASTSHSGASSTASPEASFSPFVKEDEQENDPFREMILRTCILNSQDEYDDGGVMATITPTKAAAPLPDPPSRPQKEVRRNAGDDEQENCYSDGDDEPEDELLLQLKRRWKALEHHLEALDEEASCCEDDRGSAAGSCWSTASFEEVNWGTATSTTTATTHATSKSGSSSGLSTLSSGSALTDKLSFRREDASTSPAPSPPRRTPSMSSTTSTPSLLAAMAAEVSEETSSRRKKRRDKKKRRAEAAGASAPTSQEDLELIFGNWTDRKQFLDVSFGGGIKEEAVQEEKEHRLAVDPPAATAEQPEYDELSYVLESLHWSYHDQDGEQNSMQRQDGPQSI